VSHDLKAPIRAIQGFSRMLMLEHAAALDSEASRLLQVVVDNTQIMTRLIDDLLALSRVGRQQIKKRAIDLGLMASGVFERLKEQEQ
jgi:signal transduction histidine kinase